MICGTSGESAEALKEPSSPLETSQISLAARWPLKNAYIQKILDEQRAEKDAPSEGHDGASGRIQNTSINAQSRKKGLKV